MKKAIFITGNSNKAHYLSKMVGFDIENKNLDVDEIQSLDLIEIVKHKAKEAYKKAKTPVIVEDTKLIITSLGSLPGPFIKYFLEELKADGICKLVKNYEDKTAIAGAAIAYYDGKTMEVFQRELKGEIVDEPRGESGFGWNVIFKPENSKITLGEMDDSEFQKWYGKVKPFDELKRYLESLDY